MVAKTYTGLAKDGRLFDCVRVLDGVTDRALPPRLDLCHHSPTGFSWGYGGSGPAQLAFAILYDATGDEDLAHLWHHEFKWSFLAELPKHEDFTIPLTAVQEWLRGVEAEMARLAADERSERIIPEGLGPHDA